MRKRAFFPGIPASMWKNGHKKRRCETSFHLFWPRATRTDIKNRLGLGFRLLHHHLAFVVQLAFVPVGAVEEVGLASGWARSYLWCCQCVMCAALARAGLTLASFRMCHDGIISSLSMHSNAGQFRRSHLFPHRPMTHPDRPKLFRSHSNTPSSQDRTGRWTHANAGKAGANASTRRWVG